LINVKNNALLKTQNLNLTLFLKGKYTEDIYTGVTFYFVEEKDARMKQTNSVYGIIKRTRSENVTQNSLKLHNILSIRVKIFIDAVT
jgi:hypothetical protein